LFSVIFNVIVFNEHMCWKRCIRVLYVKLVLLSRSYFNFCNNYKIMTK
jgi:hypothetical protein